MSNPLYDALFEPHKNNEACFLITDEGEQLSFRQFVGMAAQIAHVLRDAGVKPGDRIAVQAPKRVETLALYAASVQTGAVYLPLNTGYTLSELSYFISDAAPALVICQDKAEEGLSPVASAAGAALLTLNADGTGSLTAQSKDQPTEFATAYRAPGDLAALLYTSGTTGRSKGAMLSHENLLSNATALAGLWQISSSDTLIHALPIFHTHGLFVAVNTSLIAGACMRFMSRFDIDQVIEALPGATTMMGVPTFYTRLLADARFSRDITGSMRLFVSGSAPLLAETHEAFEQRTGHRILERYGMTETNMNTSNPYEGERKPGSVGFPLAGTEVKIVDSNTGEEMEPGGVGMIEVRGPNVFSGYWNMPEKTAEELRVSGFFITGDLGQIDAEGYLSIVGREKDLIITGGYNVYPIEVEDEINQVSGVVESAVFGVPHGDFGEAVIAAVVTAPGATLDTAELSQIVSERLARYKHPKRYVFVAELPRNTMGKVQKNLLRETWANLLSEPV
jgi:malonyl-CoA/methylmalonyl-CoA synthetase